MTHRPRKLDSLPADGLAGRLAEAWSSRAASPPAGALASRTNLALLCSLEAWGLAMEAIQAGAHGDARCRERARPFQGMPTAAKLLPVQALAAAGRHQELRELLRRGCNPHATGSNPCSPLMLAIGMGRFQCAEALLEAGASSRNQGFALGGSPSRADRRPLTALAFAWEERLQYAEGPQGWNAVAAILAGLLARGASLDQPDGALQTPLGVAVLMDDARLTALLCSAGADLEARASAPPRGQAISAKPSTPIELCLAHGSPRALGALIEAGAPCPEDIVETLARRMESESRAIGANAYHPAHFDPRAWMDPWRRALAAAEARSLSLASASKGEAPRRSLRM